MPGTTNDVLRSIPTGVSPTQQTGGGYAFVDEYASPGAAINEVRRRSGLSWGQLARIFGVARRSIHFWVSGKPIDAAAEERLGKLLAIIRKIDRGSADETRMALVTALPNGITPFDFLLSDAFDEVTQLLGPGIASARPSLSPLAFSAKAARRTASPGELVGARHNRVHKEMGRSRADRSAKTKGGRDGKAR